MTRKKNNSKFIQKIVEARRTEKKMKNIIRMEHARGIIIRTK